MDKTKLSIYPYSRCILLILFSIMLTVYVQGQVINVSLIAVDRLGHGAQHGLEKIAAALEEKGVSIERSEEIASAQGEILLLIGSSSGESLIGRLLQEKGIDAPDIPESLAIQWTTVNDKKVLLVSGSDDRGMMYAGLSVAERIGWGENDENPLNQIQDTVEKPYVVERALSIYTMHQKHFESYFYNEAYWSKYFDMLAQNRFNTFVLIFGYENWGYFAPPYPYFFNVEDYPDIHVVGLTPEKQKHNLRILNRLIEMTHARGLNFTLGIWDHIYRGGVQGPTELAQRPTEGIVWGLNADNLVGYSKVALQKLFQEVPALNAVQFRMHGESGLKRDEMKAFWRDIYQIMKDSGRDIRFDARAKEFPHDLIDLALEMGINIRMCTKYWMEQMGLPFHPTHIMRANQFDRRHGYADMLRYPKTYDMHWRLWNGGTTRILLWGDPQFARRFAESTHLYDGQGYEVNEPLATKMQDHPHDMEPFDLLNPQYRYYDWEFERYWHFYQVFGRVGYNPETSPEVWKREFEKRFGKQAAPHIEEALHRASWVLPRIVAYCQNEFPTTRGWVEKQRCGDLPEYIAKEPSDTEQFINPATAAKLHLEGIPSAKIGPFETHRWFAQTAQDIRTLIGEAKKGLNGKRNNEIISTLVDLNILAGLAEYHSQRPLAGFYYALFEQTQDVNALDDAIHHSTLALQAWDRIVQSAGDVYTDNLMFGRPQSGLAGHWRDELVALQREIDNLKQLRAEFKPEYIKPSLKISFHEKNTEDGFIYMKRRNDLSLSLASGYYHLDFVIDNRDRNDPCGPMWIEADAVHLTDIFTVPAGERKTVSLETVVADGKLNLVFDALTNERWDVSTIAVTPSGPRIAHVPIRKVNPDEQITVRATISSTNSIALAQLGYLDKQGNIQFTDMRQVEPSIYHADIPSEQIGKETAYFIEATDAMGHTTILPEKGREHPSAITVTKDTVPPALAHEQREYANADEPLQLLAEVTDPSGVEWVRLRFRNVNQHGDYHTLSMLPIDENKYQAVVPKHFLRPEWDFMYFFEVMDKAGNGQIFPDLEKQTPYVVVKLNR